MPRLMSVTLTEQAVVERRKNVTRRLGWSALKPGDELDLCRKVMGRKRRDGSVEPLVVLCRVRVVSVGWERLDAITDREVVLEGLRPDDLLFYGAGPEPGQTAAAFVRFFCQNMHCTPDTLVNRIEWDYLDA